MYTLPIQDAMPDVKTNTPDKSINNGDVSMEDSLYQ